jgi:lipopolysaccharide assembly protein A
MNFKITLVISLICLALIFVAQNIEIVTVSFLFWEISMSRAVLLFFSMLIGFIIGWFLNSYISYRKDKKEFSDFSDQRAVRKNR